MNSIPDVDVEAQASLHAMVSSQKMAAKNAEENKADWKTYLGLPEEEG